MKTKKQAVLYLLFIGLMVVAFSAQKKSATKKGITKKAHMKFVKKSMKKSMKGKKTNKIELKKLNMRLVKAGEIVAQAGDKPDCDSGDKQLTPASKVRTNVSGPPPQVCEQFTILCQTSGGTGYRKFGPYLRCAERKVPKAPPTEPAETLMP